MGIYDEAVADATALKRAAEENAKRKLLESVGPRIKSMVDALVNEAETRHSKANDRGDALDKLIMEPSVGISLPDEDGKITLDIDEFLVPEGGPIVVAPQENVDEDDDLDEDIPPGVAPSEDVDMDEMKLGVSGRRKKTAYDEHDSGENDTVTMKREAKEKPQPAEILPQRKVYTRKQITHMCMRKHCAGVPKASTGAKPGDRWDGAVLKDTRTDEDLGLVVKVGDDEYEIWPARERQSLTLRREESISRKGKSLAERDEKLVAEVAERIFDATDDKTALQSVRVKLAEALGVTAAHGKASSGANARLKRLSVLLNELIGGGNSAAQGDEMLNEGDVTVKISGLPDDVDDSDLAVDIVGDDDDADDEALDDLDDDNLDDAGADDTVGQDDVSPDDDLMPDMSMGEAKEEEDDEDGDDMDLDEEFDINEIASMSDDIVLEVADNDLNEELDRMRSRARQRRALSESARVDYTQDSKMHRTGELADLREELTRQRACTDRLEARLRRSDLANAKLTYTNMALQNDGLSEKQRRVAAGKIEEARSLREVKLVYDSLVESVGTKRKPTDAPEAVRKLGSSSRLTRSSAPRSLNESADRNTVETNRWTQLAGINGDD